ncbi:MAG: hypothetical protein ACRC50_02740 [Gaiella sp.]
MRIACLVLVALACQAVVAGAAGAQPASTAHEATLSHAELVQRARVICARASNGIARVRPALSLSGAAAPLTQVTAHLRRAVRELARLELAGRDALRMRRYLRLMRSELRALAAAERAARRGDRTEFREAFLVAGGVSLQARAVADRLGLAVCSTL